MFPSIFYLRYSLFYLISPPLSFYIDARFLAKTAEGDNALMYSAKYWFDGRRINRVIGVLLLIFILLLLFFFLLAFRILYEVYQPSIENRHCLNKKNKETVFKYIMKNGDPKKDRAIVTDLIQNKGNPNYSILFCPFYLLSIIYPIDLSNSFVN